ncbi:MAG: hypothetical protein ACYSR5_03475, partial [Planctomycetota bacterium]
MLLTLATLLLLVFYPYLGYKRPGIAILTSPLVSGAVVFFAIGEDLMFAAAVGPIISLATVIAVFGAGRTVELERWPYGVAKWTLVSLGALIWLGVAWFGFWGIYGFV